MRHLGVISRLMLALLCASALLMGSSVAFAMPPDASGHWAERDIGLIIAAEAADSYDDGTFRPNQPVTRAELVAMVVSGFGLGPTPRASSDTQPNYSSDIFADIGEEHWFARYAHIAFHMEIVEGYPGGNFQPDAPITRAELSTMIHRAFETPEAPGDLEYADADDIPGWAGDAITWSSSMGFMRGFPDGTYRPGELTTRAEAATLLRRAMDYRGTLFDLRGKVLKRSAAGEEVSLQLDDGNVASLEVSGVPVYRGKERVYPRDISPGETLGVLLDSSGAVAWAEIVPGDILAVIDRVDFSDNSIRVTPWIPGEWGNLSSWAEMAFWAAAGRPEAVGQPDDSIELYWTEDTEFFRQGIGVSASSLRPGDRVYLHLEAGTPALSVVDAVDFDSSGEITEVAADFSRVDWAGIAVNEGAELTPNSRIEYAGQRASPEKLEVGMRIGVVFSRDGESVGYAELYDDRMPGLLEVARADTPVDGRPDLSAVRSNPEILGITDLRDRLEVSGDGVTVAVVDTGVDPGMRGIWGRGGATLVDWKDFTGSGSLRQRIVGAPASRTAEGDVFLGDSVTVGDREFDFEGKSFRLAGRQPVDGALRVGWLYPEALGLGRGSSILVGAGKSGDGEEYDEVYVDTNGDGILRSREIFRAVDDGGRPGVLQPDGDEGPALNFIVAQLDGRGEGVSIGYDGNGHGTQVASAIAGIEGDPPPGAAPGVDLMALKALTTSGSGTWDEVLRAVRYAAENGADIINVSVTGARDLSAGGSRESRVLHEVADRYGVLIVTAAGNAGPGLATAFTPGDVRSTLAVGGATIPEVVARDYGYELGEVGVWQHSSVGPRSDGALAPAVLAPASAHVLTAAHLGSGDPVFFEGTSCAAAYATGLAALLVEAAEDRDLDYTLTGVKRAIESGARSLSGYLTVEQGFGLIDPETSWRELLADPRGEVSFSLGVDSAVMVERPYAGREPGGVYLRSLEPGSLNLLLGNASETPERVRLESEDLPSVILPSGEITIPGNGEVVVPLNYGAISEGSVQSGFIIAKSGGQSKMESRLLHTLVNPVRLDAEHNRISTRGALGPGGWERRFVYVPDGTSRLEVNLNNPGGNTGRVRVQLVDPEGTSAYLSPYIGVGSHDRDSRIESTVRDIDRPTPGVWEVNVSSSPSLSFYGLEESEFELDISLLGEEGVMLNPSRTEWRFPPGEQPDFSDVLVDIDAGSEVDLSALETYGYGWISETDEARMIPRGWVDHEPGEAYYREIHLESAHRSLTAWAANSTDPEGSDVDVYIYSYDEYGSVVPTGEGLGYAEISNPSPGKYLIVARSRAEERSSFEFAVNAWPDHNDVRVYRVTGSTGEERLRVRLGAPPAEGRFWSVVGVKDSEGNVVAETTLRVEVERSDVLLSAFPSGFEESVTLSVCLPDGKIAPGVVRLGDRIYAVDERGRVSLPVPEGAGRTRRIEIRYGSPEGEWTAPMELTLRQFSREEIVLWRKNVLPGVESGHWSSPLAIRRLSGILRGG
ncbi:MAG: S8 family serine peptidase [Bacillota bacterium]